MAYRDSIFWNENEGLALSIRIPIYGKGSYSLDIPCLPAGFGIHRRGINTCEGIQRGEVGGGQAWQREGRGNRDDLFLLLPY